MKESFLLRYRLRTAARYLFTGIQIGSYLIDVTTQKKSFVAIRVRDA